MHLGDLHRQAVHLPPLPLRYPLERRSGSKRLVATGCALKAPCRCKSLTRFTLMIPPNAGMVEDGHVLLDQHGSKAAYELLSKLSFIYPAVSWHI